jgi:hypothetical protein
LAEAISSIDKNHSMICSGVSKMTGIPRALSLVASGTASGNAGGYQLSVRSEEGSDWGVVQSPFMRDIARTTAYQIDLEVSGDEMSYSQTTFLDIYGRKFDHTDRSKLQRV